MATDDIGAKAAAYTALKQKIKEHNEKIAEYRADLEDYIKNNGQEDAKGNFIVKVFYAGQEFELKHEARVSSIPDPEIIDILRRSLGPVTFSKAVESVQIARDDVIELLNEQGKISDELLGELYEDKTICAFKVKKL